MYAAVALVIATRADVEILATCAVIGGLAAAAVALWPLITGGTILSAGARISLPSENPHLHPDPNIFAASLLLPYAILFASTIASRRLVPIVANASGLLLIVVTIVLSGSRASMLAIVALTLFILLANPRHRLIALGLLIIAGSAIAPFTFYIVSRWSNAISSGGAGREEIWKVAWLAFQQHWLFGWGFGSFEAAYDKFVLQAPLRYYVSWHRAPHDIFLQTAVDLGIVGILLVGVAFFVQFRDLSLPRSNDFLNDLRIALQATMLAFCVEAIFLDFLDRKFLWVLFMLIALVRSTLIEKRRTACATTSLPTLVPALPQTRSIASSNLSGTVG
ncbi:MAG: O-antigen ligase family protein [Vulcanimicrobiaceae bacterium]